MTWRWLTPVHSPVSTRALVDGAKAAVGLGEDSRRAVAEVLRAKYAAAEVLLTDNGTAALALALKGALPRGGTVAYPSYSCIDLSSAALGARANVRLYDLNPGTLSPDLDSLRRTIKRGVDAIVVAHLYGFPADMIGVGELASEEGIPVIEDAAQGAGGSLFGTISGASGDMSILSFGRGKGMTAGSGGALLARSPDAAEWIRRARSELLPGAPGAASVATLAAQKVLSHPSLYRLPASIPGLRLGEMVYHAPRPPRAISTASAAMLRWALEMDDREVAQRRVHGREMMRMLRQAAKLVPVRAINGGEPGFLRLPVLDQSGIKSARPDLGIMRGYPMTLDEHPQLRPLLRFGERAGTGSLVLRDRLFSLPTHSRLRESDLASVEEWVARDNIGSHAVAVLS